MNGLVMNRQPPSSISPFYEFSNFLFDGNGLKTCHDAENNLLSLGFLNFPKIASLIRYGSLHVSTQYFVTEMFNLE
jgi:hypothetical protein